MGYCLLLLPPHQAASDAERCIRTSGSANVIPACQRINQQMGDIPPSKRHPAPAGSWICCTRARYYKQARRYKASGRGITENPPPTCCFHSLFCLHRFFKYKAIQEMTEKITRSSANNGGHISALLSIVLPRVFT